MKTGEHHEDIVSESFDRYADIISECTNIRKGLIKMKKEMNPMVLSKLTKEDQQLFKDTVFETQQVLHEVWLNVVSRNRHKKQETESFFQKQKVKLQKINYELVNSLWNIRAIVLD